MLRKFENDLAVAIGVQRTCQVPITSQPKSPIWSKLASTAELDEIRFLLFGLRVRQLFTSVFVMNIKVS